MVTKTETLAERVISESDIKAERLIAVLRMTLAAMLFLGVSFVLSQSQSAGLEMRQFELRWLLAGAAGYFAIGVLNFYFATKDRMKPWMCWVFNVAEVTLVSAQLYIDVADPNTPSLLTFASPVLLVAVLVICVQVLRFQIKLHVFSTLLLVGLCAVIMFHDPQIGSELSAPASQELQLLYSVPPNIMRLLMLTALAMLIGTAIYRSKRLVETVARETEVSENRKRFLPNEIAGNMSDENLSELRLGRERDIAVLFADIRGFTSISEKIGAQRTAELLNRYRSVVTDAAIRNNGVVDKFIGDGALIIFGLHSEFNHACKDAIHAAEELLLATNNWDETPLKPEFDSIRLAIGLHAGPAVIGAIGDDRRLEFTAIGDTINTTARLEELAKDRDCTLVMSQNIAEFAGIDTQALTSLGQVSIKGREKPVEVLARL
ncbi:MAG: adenylate/guanylate cyclase domain-containing protein [Rhizobiaceae bacterium]|nr:adenylate/guanylate cyclase domain-containing protein [Rhizobiaceae bacterium]